MGIALVLLVLQTAAPTVGPVYHRPAVAPYEPPSAFGRREVEGDTDAAPERTRRLRAAWSADYEAEVLSAERAGDAAMGPLDGEWRVEVGGRATATLILSEAGDGRAQGAWSMDGGSTAERTASAVVGSETDGRWSLSGRLQGRDVHLSLASDAAGSWSGDMTRDGRTVRVILHRSE